MNRPAAGLFPGALGVWSAAALTCAVLILASACTAQAGFNVWTSHGPPGGDVHALAINPTTPSIVYAGVFGAGVFKTTDAGATWNTINAGLTSTDVEALAIDPTAPSTLYAGTG